jgi:hypothetical protein
MRACTYCRCILWLLLERSVSTYTDLISRNATILFRSGQADTHFTVFVTGFFAIVAATLFVHEFLTTPDRFYGVAGAIPLVAALIAYAALSRETIIAFDIASRRLKIVRRWFNRWDRTIVDCPFDQCAAIDLIEFKQEEGDSSFGVYVRLTGGRRYNIPLKGSTFRDATEAALHLTEVTKIPRLCV